MNDSVLHRPTGTFFREVWRIERQIRSERSRYHRVGHDGWPQQELVRFRTSQHLGFPGQDVVSAKTRRADDGLLRAELSVDCLGLTGARGALPPHYTELVLSQLKAKSPVLRDFLDLFNHRLLSLFYRSWEKTQPPVHQERQEADPFTHILKALTGSESHWEIYYGAALSRGPRSAGALKAILGDLTGMDVAIRSLLGGWEPVAAPDQTRLPGASRPTGQYARLGEAMLGSRVWMADRSVQVVFYPRSSAQLKSLLPGGQYAAAVAHITQRLASRQLRVQYRAVATASDLPGVRLAQRGRLGADSFIGTRRKPTRKVEISFKPIHGGGKAPCHR